MNAPARLESSRPRPNAKAGREVRSLINLGDTASTSRVLNLSQVYLNASKDKDYGLKPFFRDRRLNTCILIKHTLRANELDLFPRVRRTATKVILPFDPKDLRLGGSSIFVGQTGFEAFCRNFLAVEGDIRTNSDVQLLGLLDSIPSLDPFLVRELLSRNGYRPAPCYLKISASDIQKMIGFANSEIERLVKKAFGEAMNSQSIKLAGKILSDELDKELVPLKLTLRLSDSEFSDGIFSWRGFLYFKWRYLELQEEMRQVIQGLASYQPAGQADPGIPEFLNEVRPRLSRQIAQAILAVGRTLSVYDRAYGALIDKSDPAPFRQFLLDGPSLFYQLGESIAILGHISSFWFYRMHQQGLQNRLHPNDYADILMDFEEGLSNLDAEPVS